MGEETSPDEKKAVEMTPQEDGTKVLLPEDGPPVSIEEAKYVADPNGDAKIDIGTAPAFSGLTKEELMKYSNDPFWVRMRWFLFILFWVGWLAMLVSAIIIIVQTPGCKPPPELLWVEEQALLELDATNIPSAEEIASKCDEFGVSSVYLPDYISNSQFKDPKYTTTIVEDLLKKEKKVVTDLPKSIDASNPLFLNASRDNMIHKDGTWNYNNSDLAQYVFEAIVKVWIEKNVKGFIMESTNTPEKRNFKDDINALAKPLEGAVGSNITETDNQFVDHTDFEAFLKDHSEDRAFYKYNPKYVAGSTISKENMHLVTMGLFLAPGTPLLNNYDSVTNSTSELIKYLSEMKLNPGIKFGDLEFVNSTSENIVAYTRVYKGTPAYAIALNFNGNNETVSFEEMPFIGETGTIEIQANQLTSNYDQKGKKYLNNIDLGPYEGIALQFVATKKSEDD